MPDKLEIYKCDTCGNVAEILRGGGASLYCCGKKMTLQGEKVQDTGREKHLPVVEQTGGGVAVNVGSIDHPMEAGHHIEWIEVETGTGRILCKFLKAGDAPRAEFQVTEKIKRVRSYCNLHGLWKSVV